MRNILTVLTCFALGCCLSSCVFIDRYTYIDLDGENVSIDEKGLIKYERHLGGRGPIPLKYSLSSGAWTAHFVRDPHDVRGGLGITVLSNSNEQLTLKITERSRNVPRYGDCLDYWYSTTEFKQINFIDQCPDSIRRNFVLAFDILVDDDIVDRLQVGYAVVNYGYWWAPDSI